MGTKTISIMDDVYEKLRKSKRKSESFSEEIRRLLKRKGHISDCAGLWSWMTESEADKIKEGIRKHRDISYKSRLRKLNETR